MTPQTLARLVVVVSCVLFLPAVAWAQAETGNIAGVVRDTSGGVLPGVTVEAASPALIEKVRSVVSDSQGLYRIVDLRPGPYTITFTLPGFSTFRREGIELTTGFTATVNAEMRVGVVEETITVTGETPVVDVQNVQQQTTILRTTLDALPVAQRPSQFVTLIPAATAGATTFHDVGGVGTDRGFFGVHGQRADDMTFNFAGMDSRVFSGGGFQYNSHTFAEVVVETGAGSAESTTGGVQINIIPKDGGNTFSGTLSAEFTGPGLDFDNVNDDLRARGLREAPSVRSYYDIGGGLGGPIRQDRLWFFASAKAEDRSIYQVGNYFNKRQGTLFYEPDLSRQGFNRDFSRDAGVRFTWQAAAKHKIVASYTQHPGCQCMFAILEEVSPVRAPEAVAEHHYNPQNLSVLTYTYPVTSRFLIEADMSRSQYWRNQKRIPGTGFEAISVTDQGLNLEYGSRRTGYQVLNDERWHERLAVSYITGTHNAKVGVDLNHFMQGRESYGDVDLVNQAISYVFRNGVPNTVTIHNTPNGPYNTATENGVYAQDQWTIRKLTMNLGLRYAVYDAFIPEQHLPAGPYVPARDFPEVKHSPHWENLSPRLSAAYDLFGTGRTALKGSLGRYPIRNVGAAVDVPSTQQQATQTNRSWNDANGNYIPDCDLRNSAANGECGVWSDLRFGQIRTPSTRFADDAREGFNEQNYNWQGSVSVQHELRPGMGLNVGYYRTWYGGFLAWDNQAVSAASFDAYCITSPTDSRLPFSGQQICGLYDVTPALFGRQSNLITQASHYGKQTEVFQSIDVGLTARFGQGVRLQGGWSIGRTVNDTCDFNNLPQVQTALVQGAAAPWAYATPRDPAFCHLSSSNTGFGFNIVYPLPWSVQTSAIYQNKPGFPISATYVASNAEIRSSLGRNLAACPSQTAATCNQNVTVDLIPRNTVYGERIKQLDLRLSRTFPMGGRTRLQGNFDLYNILNESTVLNENTRYSLPNGGPWRNAVQIMGGRLIKFGAQLSF
ncbi:MAG: carboxypeptidase regulatory-like domain-containing protein [Vicinamibacterales bacterium]